jgi:hypothetical protein
MSKCKITYKQKGLIRILLIDVYKINSDAAAFHIETNFSRLSVKEASQLISELKAAQKDKTRDPEKRGCSLNDAISSTTNAIADPVVLPGADPARVPSVAPF